MTEDVATSDASSSAHRRARAATTLLVLDVVVIALLALLDRVEVSSRDALDRVSLGMPLTWVTQDQAVDPPLPFVAGFMPPWEHPTSVAWAPLVANLVIVGLVLLGAWNVVRGRRSLASDRVAG